MLTDLNPPTQSDGCVPDHVLLDQYVDGILATRTAPRKSARSANSGIEYRNRGSTAKLVGSRDAARLLRLLHCSPPRKRIQFRGLAAENGIVAFRGLDPVDGVDSLGGATVAALATQLAGTEGIVPTRSALLSMPELSTPTVAKCDSPRKTDSCQPASASTRPTSVNIATRQSDLLPRRRAHPYDRGACAARLSWRLFMFRPSER